MFEVKTKANQIGNTFDPINDSDLGTIIGLCLFLLYPTSSQAFIVSMATVAD